MRAMKKYVTLTFFLTVFFLNAYSQGFMKTSLEITIRDRLGNTVEGVKVKIYKTYEDFQSDINFIQEPLQTNAKGKVVFKNLESIPYYISAVKGDNNNYGDGEMVDTLVANRKNKVTIIIR